MGFVVAIVGLGRRMGKRLARASNLPLKLMLASVAVGAIAGLAGVAFHKLTDWVQRMALQSELELTAALGQTPFWWKIVLPAVGGALIAPIVFRLAPETRGAGVTEVMKAVSVDQGRIRRRVAPAKLLASAFTIGTGGSVGREGPIIQIGAAVASGFAQMLKWSSQRTINLTAAGVAAGIAAIFNAPIAGAFFALEVVLRNFAASSFAPIVLASVTATAVSRAFLGDYPAFRVPPYALVSGWEIPTYVLLGLVAGLVGLVMIVTTDQFRSWFARLPVHDFSKPILGGLGVGLCLLVAPQVYGTGFGVITEILVHGMPLTILLVLLPIKLLATSLTTASGGSGGMFSPSLFVGAAVGYLFGTAANAIFPGYSAPPGAYALVGMGAVLSGVTHAPIASILILFEITGDYQIIPPLMLTCATATLLSSVLLSESFYTLPLVRQGIEPHMRREEALMRTFRVEDVMRPGGRTVSPACGLSKLVTEFLSGRVNERYVVADGGDYIGFISLHDIKEVLGEEGLEGLVVAGDVCHRDVPEVPPHMSLSDCMQRFVATGTDRLPVVSEVSGHFLGTISEHDIIGLYNREILRKDFLGTLDLDDDIEEHRPSMIHLPHDYLAMPVLLPEALVGRSLKDTHLRERFGLTVVAIRDPDTAGQDEVPHPERPLERGVHLVVVGHADEIERFIAFGEGSAPSGEGDL